jgi:hypothetical protein
MTSTSDDGITKDQIDQIMQLILDGKKPPNEREIIEAKPAVMQLKLVSGQEVVGEFVTSDEKEVYLMKVMKVDMRPNDGTTLMKLDMWCPFGLSNTTQFQWDHVISYDQVEDVMAEYYFWMWKYQSLMVKPGNLSSITALNLQLSSSLSNENLKFIDKVKDLRKAGLLYEDYPDTTQ